MINLSLPVVLSELSKFYNVKVLLSVAWSFLRIGLPPNNTYRNPAQSKKLCNIEKCFRAFGYMLPTSSTISN